MMHRRPARAALHRPLDPVLSIVATLTLAASMVLAATPAGPAHAEESGSGGSSSTQTSPDAQTSGGVSVGVTITQRETCSRPPLLPPRPWQRACTGKPPHAADPHGNDRDRPGPPCHANAGGRGSSANGAPGKSAQAGSKSNSWKSDTSWAHRSATKATCAG